MMMDDELTRALRENEMLAAENERLLRELRDATDKYTAIRNSLSWKLTAPLRKAMDIVAKPKPASAPLLLNDENYQLWIAQFDTLTSADRTAIRNAIATLKKKPLFTVLVVIHDDPAPAILQTVQSIRRQLYRDWEICLVDDASTAPHISRALASCGDDPRVRILRRTARDGDAKGAALAMARGEFAAYIDPGDVLSESALFEFAAEINLHPDATALYSDEDSLNADGKRCNPRFKTDWNPDLFREQNYLDKLLFRKTNEEQGSTRHIPSVLCHCASYQPPPVCRQHPELPNPAPKVSVIIPTRDRAELLQRCLDGILKRTNYSEIEILILDNQSREESTKRLFTEYPVRVVAWPGEFNWAAMNNAGARAATGDILLFLNNDTDVISEDWLRELAAHAIRPGVGAVGAKLLFADGAVQHAGIWLGPHMAVHHFLRLSNREDEGYLGQLSITRNLSAVTGACLATRRDLFLEVGGFDESFPVGYNDIDFCLRLIEQGHRIVWTPHAEMFHLESASRGSGEWRWRKEEAEFVRFRDRWAPKMESDPFFNPNLDLIGEEKLALAFPPRVKKPWRLG